MRAQILTELTCILISDGRKIVGVCMYVCMNVDEDGNGNTVVTVACG